MTTETKYTAWDLLNEISLGRIGSDAAPEIMEKMDCEIAYHLKTAGEESTADMFLNISRLEDKGVVSMFDGTGRLLYANLGVEYDFLDFVHRTEQIALHMKDVAVGTELDNELSDIYGRYVDSMFNAANSFVKYAVMTGEVVIPEDMEDALTPENVSEWLDNVPGGDLIEVVREVRYFMRGYCDLKFDASGILLPEKSRGDIQAMKELVGDALEDVER